MPGEELHLAHLLLPRHGTLVEEPGEPIEIALAGTVDQVKAEFDALKRVGGDGDLEWFAWFFDQGAMPWEEEMRQMELFAEHIIPAFR